MMISLKRNYFWLFLVSTITLAGCRAVPFRSPEEPEGEVDLNQKEVRQVFESLQPDELVDYGLEVAWKARLPVEGEGEQVRRFDVTGERLLVESFYARLYHLDIESGDGIGVTRLKDVITAPPVMHNDKVFVHTFRGWVIIGAHSCVVQKRLRGRIAISASPVPYGDSLIVGARTGALMRLKAEDGSGVWKRSLRSMVLDPLVAVDDMIFVSSGRRLIVAEFSDGNFTVDWTPPDNSPITSGPAVVNDRIFVGSRKGFIYCLSKGEGEGEDLTLKWRFPTGSAIKSVQAVQGDRLLVATNSGELLLLEAGESPEEVWSHPYASRFLAASGAGLYCLTEGNELLLIDAETGEEKWNLQLQSDSLVASYPDGPSILIGTPNGEILSLVEKD